MGLAGNSVICILFLDFVRFAIPCEDNLGNEAAKLQLIFAPCIQVERSDTRSLKENKPPIINQQHVVYYYKCAMCDANCVGYTCRHFNQRVEEHKGSSSIVNHIKYYLLTESEVITGKCQTEALMY